jgi:GTP-binding protein EngB required for normal cell division
MDASVKEYVHGGASASQAVSDAFQMLPRLAAACDRFSLTALEPLVEACRAMQAGEDLVDVAVFGRFKAGKSSMLNRLAGRDALPVDVLPATAVITTLSHGGADLATAHDLDGRTTDLPLAAIREYVTERENPGNCKRVARVEVKLPMPDGLAGLRLVDTPGLGSVHENSTRAALDWLPRVGAALVAINVTQPLGEDDLKLIRELLPLTPEVDIVLTKADLVSARQLDEVIRFTSDQLRSRLGRDFLVFAFSALPGHEDLTRGLVQFLAERYSGNHAAQARRILAHKLQSLRESCLEYLELARGAALADEAIRARLLGEARQELAGMHEIDDDFRLMIEDLRTRSRVAAEQEFLPHRSVIVKRMRAELKQRQAGWRGGLARELRGYREWLAQALDRELRPVAEAHGDAWRPLLDEAASRVNRVVRAVQDRFAAEVKRALNMPFGGGRFEARVEPPRRPDIHLSRTFDTNLDSIWFLIPMWIFRGLAHGRFRAAIAWEVEKNLYRLASQWAEAMNASISDMATQAETFMREELDTIIRLLDQSDGQLERLDEAIADLRRLGAPGEESATRPRAQAGAPGGPAAESGPDGRQVLKDADGMRHPQKNAEI